MGRSRGSSKATHYPSLEDAVKYVVENEGSKLVFFRLGEKLLDKVHAKYNEIAVGRGYYKNYSGSKNRSQGKKRLVNGVGQILRTLGYKRAHYNRLNKRRDKFGQEIFDHHIWVPIDWDGFPESLESKLNKSLITTRNPYYREEE